MFRFLFLFWLSFHPVHVSLTSLDYLSGKGIMKGFVRIYFDDFLLDCRCEADQEKLIANEKSSLNIIEEYLNTKLLLTVNNKTIPGEVENVEISNNEVDIDINYSLRRRPGTITIKSLINTAIYNDQANMVIIKVDDFEEGVRLTSTVSEQTFKVN